MHIERVENGYILIGPPGFTTQKWVYHTLEESLLHIAAHVGRAPVGTKIFIQLPDGRGDGGEGA